jgi:hypothetical protein
MFQRTEIWTVMQFMLLFVVKILALTSQLEHIRRIHALEKMINNFRHWK